MISPRRFEWFSNGITQILDLAPKMSKKELNTLDLRGKMY